MIKITNEDIIWLAQKACKMEVPAWLKVSVPTPSDCETPYHRFLYLLSAFISPCEIVELGTREGIGALALGSGNAIGNVYTFDIQDQRHYDCKRENVFFYNMDSLNIPQSMSSRIQLLFIDTIHDGSRPLMEFERWKDLVEVGGIIIFDDIELNDAMKIFWHNFEPMGYEKINLPELHTSGFGLLIKQSE